MNAFISKYKHIGFCCHIIVFVTFTQIASAEVVLDGSMGTTGNVSGPNYEITSDMGKVQSNNLYHSFSTFNLSSGESANFSGPSNVTNIYGRVTGPSYSNIDGTLSSSINGANLWLINPNGIVFGKNAQLNISGSFYATTADYIKFDNGDRFNASLGTESILSVANPVSFGFIKDAPVGIAVQQSNLKVAIDKQIVLAGGPVTLTNSTISAPEGRVDLVAVGGAGEASFSTNATTPRVEIANEVKKESINLVNSQLLTKGSESGGIYLVGGKFYMDAASRIENEHTIAVTSTGIDIHTTSATIDGGIIQNNNLSSGKGAAIVIDSSNVTIRSDVSTSQIGKVSSTAVVDGATTGNITINGTETIELNNGAIEANATGGSVAGEINVTSKNLALLNAAKIHSSSAGQGDAGAIKIDAQNFGMSGNSQLRSEVNQSNSGGIIVNATNLAMLENSNIESLSQGAGKGADIQIESTTTNLRSGARISSTASGSGSAGDILVCAENRLLVDQSSIRSQPGTARGGNIYVGSNGSVILNKSEISASGTVDGSGQTANVNIGACHRSASESSGALQSIVQNKSSIASSGGKTSLASQSILHSSDSLITGSEGTSVNGTITSVVQRAEPEEQQAKDKVVALNIAIFTAGTPAFQSPCANAVIKPRGSFLVRSQIPLQASPGDFYVSATSSGTKSNSVASAFGASINGCGE